MTEEEFTDEVWVYTGRRQLDKGLAVSFVDQDGEERLFSMGKGVKHRTLGGEYKLPVARQADGHVSVKIGMLEFVRMFDDPEKLAEWDVQDRAAYTADQVRKKEQAGRGQQAFANLSVVELRDQMSSLPYAQRAAMVAQVITFLYS